ncbi:LysM domain-containing protein [Colletotrichum spinosum]|uniref:LysM domain-containing protein n=1 Tax=Colletotrichum spinosum TaxID=1347390 RepID=A0A4R8Q2T3_9PEZI|nr:LysM domain-containing protein [Colletotrichum spinosum]
MLVSTVSLALLAGHIPGALGLVYLANITNTPDGLASSCVTVLKQGVDCDPALLDIDPAFYETDAVLSSLCTTACTTALTTYQRRVVGACGTSRYTDHEGWSYLASYDFQERYEAYQAVCLQDSSGRKCNAAIRDALHMDPDAMTTSAAPEPTLACDKCFLSSIALRIQQPLASDELMASKFSSLTSSCGSTTFAITTPATTTWAIPPTSEPTSTPKCVGTTYTIQSGDTCLSISKSRGISTSQLLVANHLPAFCSSFPSSGTVCIPDSSSCKTYETAKGDKCRDVADKNGISWTQVVTWNPELGQACEYIDNFASRGYVLCASNPGGSWVHPFPEDEVETPPIKTTAVHPAPTVEFETFEAMPSPTRADLLPNLGALKPLANGTRKDCANYAEAPIELNSTITYDCEDVAAVYDVSVDDLKEWNPDLAATAGLESACELQGGYRYCVSPDELRGPDVTEYCVRETVAEPGWGCADYAFWFGVNVTNLVEWNPDIGQGCENFRAGYTFCSGVKHFRPAGQISTCTRWVMANATEAGANPCDQFVSNIKIPKERLVAWNPSIKSDCSGIVKNYDYCVAIPLWQPPA